MKTKIFTLAAVIVLSGCSATADDYAALNPDSKFVQASCQGAFKLSTAGGNAVQSIDIEMLKRDRVGNGWVKVKRGQGIKFLSPWVDSKSFESIKCENQAESILAKI